VDPSCASLNPDSGGLRAGDEAMRRSPGKPQLAARSPQPAGVVASLQQSS
jgi:hypothetical protein